MAPFKEFYEVIGFATHARFACFSDSILIGMLLHNYVYHPEFVIIRKAHELT